MTATIARQPLTPRQHQIYTALVRFIADHGQVPTIREIAALVGISSPNGVVVQLQAIHRKGWVEFIRDGTARNLRVPELDAALKAAAAALLKQGRRK